jgi:hypothetical protein
VSLFSCLILLNYETRWLRLLAFEIQEEPKLRYSRCFSLWFDSKRAICMPGILCNIFQLVYRPSLSCSRSMIAVGGQYLVLFFNRPHRSRRFGFKMRIIVVCGISLNKDRQLAIIGRITIDHTSHTRMRRRPAGCANVD